MCNGVYKNYKDVDILFLHKICIIVDNKANNNRFTYGYGLNNTAYLITRRYIQTIIDTYGKLPEPNGQHLDFETMLNCVDKDNFTKEMGLYVKKRAYQYPLFFL